MGSQTAKKLRIEAKKSEQLSFLPMKYEDLVVVRSQDRTSIFCRGFCLFTFESTDKFSRNYCMVQMHLAGKIKLKKLSEIFGLSYQYCSRLLGQYKQNGVSGLIEQTIKRTRNRKIIDEEIGGLILELRAREATYQEISQIIRFKFHKKVHVQSIRAWVCKNKKEIKVFKETDEEQLVIEECEEEGEEIGDSGEWRWNSYAGSMLLYGMIERSGFLRPFEEFITEDVELKKSSWSVRRVLLTLFFLHALRCKSIEQSKHLVGKDFREIVGGNFLRLQWLRYAVDDIVNHENYDKAIESFYKDMISQTDLGDGVYYTDGHFSSYYGRRRVPMGYDARRKMGFRGRNTIFLHNTLGEVLYFFESPTNTSLSNDIEKLVSDMTEFGMDLKRKTLMFDRGGFSQKCFKYLKKKKMYFVTYLKNRKKEREIDEKKFKVYRITTEDGEDVEYKIYEKERRATRYGNVRTVVFLGRLGRQVPILTNNPYMKLEKIVYLLQRRWREENCFKYMIEHFGIDLMTTYKTKEAPNKIIKRTNPKRRELNRKLTQKKNELERMQSELAKKIESKGKDSEETIKEFLEEEKELEFVIKNIVVDIDYLERKRQEQPTKIEINLKDEHVIITQKRRLLINGIKAMNYNAEKWLQIMFKEEHKKIDETLSVIRNLWRQPGRIRNNGRNVDVELEALDMQSMQTSLDRVIKKMKETNQLRLPDGKSLCFSQIEKV